MKNSSTLAAVLCFVIKSALISAFSQGIPPYPNATTDRLIHVKSSMAPPVVNTVFADPDFGSSMVRVTDENTDLTRPGSFFRNPDGSVNAWSADGQKFFFVREGGANLAFGFDSTTMSVGSLPGAQVGAGLPIPLRTSPTFSFTDPDLMYGTLPKAPLTIATYRFSTGRASPLFDTSRCGMQPALAPNVYSDDLTTSTDDNRIVVSEGGKQFGSHMFVTVFDKQLGCRWYNTQMGQIGGQWGAVGQASVLNSYLVRHSSISGSGRYVKISVDYVGFYVWDVATLNVMACPIRGGVHCAGYAALGYDTHINAAGAVDEMSTLKRPLGELSDATALVNPLPLPHYWGMEKNFAWGNGHLNDDVPVCGNTYSYDGDTSVTQPYDGEIFCIETDGLASTIWRFGHNRSVWNSLFYYTLPFANISHDGSFLMFTSSWDDQVGIADTRGPRTDVWIVRLQ